MSSPRLRRVSPRVPAHASAKRDSPAAATAARAAAPPEKHRRTTRKPSGPVVTAALAPESLAELRNASADIWVPCPGSDGRQVLLTNLSKPFWPELGLCKRDILVYYAEVALWLLPHIRERAMVMKRYPNGAHGPFFFMKRAPLPRPTWIETCAITHRSGEVIRFPVINDVAALLWVVNLGCIDLNPWYARTDDVDCPDYLHFDLDPVPGASFATVCDVALVLREALLGRGAESAT